MKDNVEYINPSLVNNKEMLYNGLAGGNKNENDRRSQQYDKRAISRLFEEYRTGKEINATSPKSSFTRKEGQINVTEKELKLALIDYANKYKKIDLNPTEQELKSIINYLNGDVVFFEFGDDNFYQGLANKEVFYIDVLGEEKVENIFYHELTHFLRQNNNEIYCNRLQPIVNSIATNFENQEYIFKYALSKEEFNINDLNGSKQYELAEEVLADNIANIFGDLEIDYTLPENIRQEIYESVNEILNQAYIHIETSSEEQEDDDWEL